MSRVWEADNDQEVSLEAGKPEGRERRFFIPNSTSIVTS